MSEKSRHILPGEHRYQNMTLAGYMQPQVLERIRGFSLDKDVVVVSYPRTGKHCGVLYIAVYVK